MSGNAVRTPTYYFDAGERRAHPRTPLYGSKRCRSGCRLSGYLTEPKRMSNIRRYYVTDAPVFITAVCYQRQAILRSEEAKRLLIEAMREVKQAIPYRMLGYVILDDHFHWIILPPIAMDFPRIMQSVKLRFARRIRGTCSTSRRVWQPRFWDHVIRDAGDHARHLDYLHYNPAKHGYVADPAAYCWSSLRSHMTRGRYPVGWAVSARPMTIEGMDCE